MQLTRGGRATRYSVGQLVAFALAIISSVACGSGGAEPTPVPVALTADVCTEGEARDTKLHIKNLDDFEWRNITFSLVKAGNAYTWEWPGLSPESHQAAQGFTDAAEFYYEGLLETTLFRSGGARVTQRGSSEVVQGIIRLHNFSNLESASIEIRAPQLGKWTGEVYSCE